MKNTMYNKKTMSIGTVVTALLSVVIALVFATCTDDSGGTPTYEYVCDNGTADNSADDKPDRAGVNKCASCDDFFKLNGENCVATEYTCPYGTATTGQPNASTDGTVDDKNVDIVKCATCKDGYRLDNQRCVATAYTCSNGDAVEGKPSGNEDAENCNKCHTGFIKDGNACVTAYDYVCQGGTKADGQTKDQDTTNCTSCKSDQNYLLVGQACELFALSAELSLSGTATANNATLSITPSHSATVHWVVYADDTTKSDAATVISDADDSKNIGIDRSGSAGDSADAAQAHTISVKGLSAQTSYVAYAAVTSVANSDIVILSGPVSITTTVEGVAKFTSQPTASNITQTTADIAFIADEDAKLYWVLYDSPQNTTPTAGQLKSDALGSGGVDRSGTGQTVVATTAKSISLGGTVNLKPLTPYYFYALIEDSEDNQTVSAVAMFKTTGYTYICSGGVASTEDAVAANITKCTSCTVTSHWFDNKNESCIAYGTLASGGYGVSANKVTVTCAAPAVAVGDKFTINGTEYTKRSNTQINAGNAATACTTDIASMDNMFRNQQGFNVDISHWDTSSVTRMVEMFYNANSAANTLFNQDISEWDVSKVTTMSGMFRNSDFNQDIGKWNVSRVTTMNGMFRDSAFNKDISDWDVSRVSNMSYMFTTSDFNQNISKWNTSRVNNMSFMFQSSQFKQDVSGWCVSGITSSNDRISFDSPFMTSSQIPDWGNAAVVSCPVRFSAQPSVGTGSTSVEASTTSTHDANLYWVVYKDNAQTFANSAAVKAAAINANAGAVRSGSAVAVTASDAEPFTISPLEVNTTYYLYAALERVSEGEVISSTVANEVEFLTDCQDGYARVDDGTCQQSIMFEVDATNGVTVICDNDPDGDPWPVGTVGMIAGSSQGYTKRTTDSSAPADHQITVANAAQSCTSGITDMSNLFRVGDSYGGTADFNGNIRHWDTSDVTTMSNMFRSASSFNEDIRHWDTSRVENMSGMFRSATAFNRSIGDWDVSKVTDMSSMFRGAQAFNGDIRLWVVSAVTTMNGMFYDADDFVRDIGDWYTVNVTNMSDMYGFHNGIKPDLSGWCVVNVSSRSNFDNGGRLFASGHKPNWGGGTNSNCPVRFRSQPSVGDGGTSVTVSATTTREGNLYWIVYDSPTSFADSDALKTAINASEGISRIDSMNPVVMPVEQAKTFDVGGLSMGTRYYLYTVVERVFSNSEVSSVVSDEVSFLTDCPSGSVEENGVCVDAGATFTLHENGVTVICDNDPDGDPWPLGTIGRTSPSSPAYKKRTTDSSADAENRITPANAASSCTSGVTNMNGLFTATGFGFGGINYPAVSGANSFNGDISHWDTSSVTSMLGMFRNADSFARDISKWDVSNVTTMNSMFRDSDFNQDISAWQTDSLTNMANMFFNAPKFNQNIGSWNTSNVTDMRTLFRDAEKFNGNIGSWDVSNVEASKISSMFRDATAFTQDISEWCVTHIPAADVPDNFDGGTTPATWTDANKPQWGTSKGNNCAINFIAQPTYDSTDNTVSLTASEVGKLYWILYSSDTSLANVAALKTAIDTDGVGVQKSDAAGEASMDDVAQNVTLTTLTGGATYYFYAGLAIEETDGTIIESKLSNKIMITAP